MATALQIELATDPLGRGYAGMTDAECAASLNTRNRRGAINTASIRQYLHFQSKWSDVRAKSLGLLSATAPQRVTALYLIDYLTDFETVDYDIAAHAALGSTVFDACVAAGFMINADKGAILALGDNLRTRGEQIGHGYVKVGHVTEARV